MTEKRRLLSLLPAWNQSRTLRNFFGATVDQVFQPGRLEAISGYIGNKPDGYDPTRDFYIAEPTPERANYQLNVGMVVKDNEGVVNDLLTYPDLVNYMASVGALTNDHHRLFEGDRYVWSPPINIDAISNFPQYCWFGDNVDALPSLNLIAPVVTYTADGNTATFALPPSLYGIDPALETPCLYVNGVAQPSINDGTTITMVGVSGSSIPVNPVAGATVMVSRHEDISPIITGTTFSLHRLLGAVTITADGQTTSFTIPAPYDTADVSFAVQVDGVDTDFTIQTGAIILAKAPVQGSTIAVGQPFHLAPLFARYLGDGVATAYPAPSVSNAPASMTLSVTVNGVMVPYTLSNDGSTVILDTAPAFDSNTDTTAPVIVIGYLSPIAVAAASVNTDTFGNRTVTPDLSGVPFSPVSALSSSMKVVMVDPIRAEGPWDIAPWDQLNWDPSAAGEFYVDGVGRSIRLTDITLMQTSLVHPLYVTIDRSSIDQNPYSMRNHWVHRDSFAWSLNAPVLVEARSAVRPIIEFERDMVLWNYGWYRALDVTCVSTGRVSISGQPFGTVVDDGHAIHPNDILLIAQSTPYDPAINNAAYVCTVDPQNQNVIKLVPIGEIGSGAVCRVGSSYEIWYDGSVWRRAQTFAPSGSITDESFDPKFALYDIEGLPLDDAGAHPHQIVAPFTGSRIFGYAPGTASVDPILQRRTSFETATGYLEFENDIATRRYSDDNGPIPGMYGYGVSTGGAVTRIQVWHEAAQTSTQSIVNGFWDIPQTLRNNPISAEVAEISRGGWTDHFNSILANQVGFSGHVYAGNNYRDTARDVTLGTAIMQHSAPLLKLMLFASDQTFDIPAALRYADLEFNRFRNKFGQKLLDLSRRGVLEVPLTPDQAWIDNAVALTLTKLKADKSTSFPFANSPMAGGGYYIPPTPPAFGLLKASTPAIVTDTNFGTATLMIRGHDGSLTPAYNDWRDACVLGLEKLIYAHLPAMATNEAELGFDIRDYLGGRFSLPEAGYAAAEVQQLLAPIYENWVATRRLDGTKNTTYNEADPFTWNYRGIVDRTGMPMPGSWRGIFLLYYDTTTPHLTPWEMLGFTDEPEWWQAVYGPAPYTSDRANMWSDLERGVIQQGPRAGIDVRYIRPDLASCIPVNIQGLLLDPYLAGIVVQQPTPFMAARDWLPGDYGPVEFAWRQSSSYRFALAQVAFLGKPARFVELLWDIDNIGYIGSQWVDLRLAHRGERPQNANLYVHGEVDPSTGTKQRNGIQQWISDALIASGRDISLLGTAVRNLTAQLVHKMAGFVSSDNLQVVTDNFGLLPSEDVSISLYESPTERIETYSGVIVLWNGVAWQVFGFDTSNPIFSIIPPDINSARSIISLRDGPEPVINPWRSNIHYRVDMLTEVDGTVYRCVRAHLSGSTFAREKNYWAQDSTMPTVARRVTRYTRGLNQVQKVQYGTEFTTFQAVADFLLGYERYLVSRGWAFDVVDPNSLITRDWTDATREFLIWSQVHWKSGNFIALSPGASQLHFHTDQGTVLDIEDGRTAFYGLLDRTGTAIDKRNVHIDRLDGDLNLQANGADIFCCRLRVAEFEHALTVSNVTVFGDVLYVPVLGQRQARLRLIGGRSTDWTGRLDAPGYVISGDTLEPSFEKAADDVRLMFDVEHADSKTLRSYARHNIGYQDRSYLDNVFLGDNTQFEYYQGMIGQKGTASAMQALRRSQRVTNSETLSFLDEWAVRVSRFGAPVRPRVSFLLGQTETRRDPQLIQFNPTVGAPEDWVGKPLGSADWLDRPASANVFPLKSRQPPSLVNPAGPVRISDTQYSYMTIQDILDSYTSTTLDQSQTQPQLLVGERVWVYSPPGQDWTVLRSCELGSQPNTIASIVATNGGANARSTRIFMHSSHGLTSSDVGAVVIIDDLARCTPDVFGTQVITAVNTGSNWFEVSALTSAGYDFSTDTTNSPPHVRILRSVRFATRPGSYPFTPVLGDLIWINSDSSFGNIGTVLAYNGTSFVEARRQPQFVDGTSITNAMIYDQATKITSTSLAAHEPLLDRINVIDPMNAIFPGVALDEISYILDRDPARYTSNIPRYTNDPDSNPWNAQQVGQLWWDTSAVRFVEPYTDELGHGLSRDLAELDYRSQNWCSVAPNTSVDVYEWVRSDIDPFTWSNQGHSGTVYDPDLYVEESVYDPAHNRMQSVFYFWVKGLTTVPANADRKRGAVTVAQMLTNPTAAGLPWVAAIAADTVLISGVANVLNDASTVLKVETKSPIESTDHGHSEWALLRADDENSLPPDWLWRKLTDSLAGFDATLATLPSTTLPPSRRVGTDPGQSLFVQDTSDGPRHGLLDGRQALVGIVNTIFARNPILIDRPTQSAMLYRTDPQPQTWQWSRIDNTYDIEAPPGSAYDLAVYTLEQRNRLLSDTFFAQIKNYSPIGAPRSARVLLDYRAHATPQWSIYQIDLYAASVLRDIITSQGGSDNAVAQALYDNAGFIFKLCTAYDVAVANRAARDALLHLTSGQVVYVESDNQAGGFWTLWLYDPSDTHADSAGFVLMQVQKFDTHDFINIVDWYATGYSANTPPTVSYADARTRDLSQNEGPVPTNLLVRLDNDGSGHWVWTAYQGGSIGWTIVARQNGTLALSNRFYDASRVVHDGFMSTVINRDGSFELRALMAALRHSGVLTDAEVNEVFFSILQFVHSQQDDVDWAFKTSFLFMAGYNLPLIQSPFQNVDLTNNLLTYIDEIKPYRVKVRDYTIRYAPDIDIASIHATDFDFPPYFESSTGKYRILNPLNDADLAIIQKNAPWSDWYANAENNLVRNFDITMSFDRITGPNAFLGETSEGIFAGAYQRMLAFYRDQPDVDVAKVMGLEGDYVTLDGSTLVDVPGLTTLSVGANGNTTISGYGLDAAFVGEGRPQERAALLADDGLIIRVIEDAAPGASPQRVNTLPVGSEPGATVDVLIGQTPESSDAVMVFRDSLLLNEAEYAVDLDAASATVDRPAGTETVSVHSFGDGDGQVFKSELTYVVGQSWTLPVIDTVTLPEVASTVVFVDGKRLQPPKVHYGRMTTIEPFLRLDSIPTSSADLTLYVNGNLYPFSIPIVAYNSTATVNQSYPFNMAIDPSVTPNNYRGDFVVFDHYLVSLDPSFVPADVVLMVNENYEYTVSSGVLTIWKPLTNASKIVAYSLPAGPNYDDVRTYSFAQADYGRYRVDPLQPEEYSLVSSSGLTLSPSTDYRYTEFDYGWDSGEWDSDVWDCPSAVTMAIVSQEGALVTGTPAPIIATIFRAPPAHGEQEWLLASRTSSFSRHIVLGQDGSPYGGEAAGPMMAVPPHGGVNEPARVLTSLDRRFELTRLDTALSGSLTADLLPGAVTMQVTVTGLPGQSLPFVTPYPGHPGVVWVDNERIEYQTLTATGSTVVLGKLRRGTNNTVAAQEQRSLYRSVLDGQTSLLTISGTGEDVAVAVNHAWLDTSAYVVSVGTDSIDVFLNHKPGAGSILDIYVSDAPKHLAGTEVFNGNLRYRQPAPLQLNAIF